MLLFTKHQDSACQTTILPQQALFEKKLMKPYLPREFQANVVSSLAVRHEVARQLAVRQHHISEVQGACDFNKFQLWRFILLYTVQAMVVSWPYPALHCCKSKNNSKPFPRQCTAKIS